MAWSSGFLLLLFPALAATAGVAGDVAAARSEPAIQLVQAAPAIAPPTPVIGDFDDDQRSDLLWYGPGASDDHLWFAAPGRRFTGEAASVGGDYLPLTGDFNGDSHDDIFWYGSGLARDYVWSGAGGHGFVGRQPVVNGAYQPFVADFNGDRRDDVFWYQPGPGGDVVWYGKVDGSFSARSVTFTGSQAPVVGDFDGNGTADIVWYGEGGAPDALWRGVHGGGFSGRSLRVQQVYTPRVGDFNGDGRDDLIWFGPGSAGDVVWYGGGNGGFFGRTVTADSAGAPLVGDFDGNGASDLFWYQPGADADEIWFGHSSGFSRSRRNVIGTYAPIVADFDGDRTSDVLWYAAGAPPDPLWYGGRGGTFTPKSSIVDIHPALAPPVDQQAVAANYDLYGVLGHEMGPTPEGVGYTSSLEAFNHNYGRGFRVFEADFVRLADGSALAAHPGLEARFGLNRPFSEVTRADLAGRHFQAGGHAYTPLFSDDVVRLMRQHPDIYIVLDTKVSDVWIFTRVLRDAGRSPALMERVIPHIYDQGQLDEVQDLYPVHSYMVALYRSQFYNRLDDSEVVTFVRRNRAPAVMMWSGTRDPSLSLHDNMSEHRRYTDSFASRLSTAGAVAYVHSISRTQEAINFKRKGVAIYSSGPFPPYSAAQPEVLVPEDEADAQVP